MAETSSAYTKPLPAMRGLTKEFYDWCGRGELRFQRCDDCNAWRHVPREMCGECGSWSWQWQRSTGRGTVFTWTTIERPLSPSFKDACPYAPVVVEMEEGVRLLSELTDCPPDQLQMGMAVEVVYDSVTPEVTLPKFKRA